MCIYKGASFKAIPLHVNILCAQVHKPVGTEVVIKTSSIQKSLEVLWKRMNLTTYDCDVALNRLWIV